jgi:hypothetical protein
MNEDQFLQPLQTDTWVGKETQDERLTLRERLMKLFDATDFVRVMNIDTEPFTWQYMPAQKEHISFDTTTSTVPMKETFREPPEVYQLMPAQSAIIVGASAFIMIEALIKRMVSEEAVSRDREYPGVKILPGGRSRKFAFSDPIKQQELISRIYLGKHMPGMSVSTPAETSRVEEDLGLTEIPPVVNEPERQEPQRRQGRPPRRAVA